MSMIKQYLFDAAALLFTNAGLDVTALNIAGVLVLVTGVSILVYLLPAIIAEKRKHHYRTAILWLNLLAGWTAIGWIAALVWANRLPRYQRSPAYKALVEMAEGRDPLSEFIKLTETSAQQVIFEGTDDATMKRLNQLMAFYEDPHARLVNGKIVRETATIQVDDFYDPPDSDGTDGGEPRR
jgi:hypothetical protein